MGSLLQCINIRICECTVTFWRRVAGPVVTGSSVRRERVFVSRSMLAVQHLWHYLTHRCAAVCCVLLRDVSAAVCCVLLRDVSVAA